MAVDVVDLLEAVEIEQEQRPVPIPIGRGKQAPHGVVEQHPVRSPVRAS